MADDLHTLDNEQLEAMIAAGTAELIKRARESQKRKRQRDAERHLDVHCPGCGAKPRGRCLCDGKRTDVSHQERAWKPHGCPACGVGAGEWCKDGPVYITRIHAARAQVS